MSTQIARIGRTIAVEIPEELLRAAGLDVGDQVDWSLSPQGTLSLHPATGEDALADTPEESRRWEEILDRLTRAHDADRDAPEAEPDWLLSHGTEYKRPAED